MNNTFSLIVIILLATSSFSTVNSYSIEIDGSFIKSNNDFNLGKTFTFQLNERVGIRKYIPGSNDQQLEQFTEIDKNNPGIKFNISLTDDVKASSNLNNYDTIIFIKSLDYQKIIRENIESAKLAYQLVTLDDQVPIEYQLDDLLVREPDSLKLVSLFRELEFKVMVERF